jgi:hypothetical protein
MGERSAVPRLHLTILLALLAALLAGCAGAPPQPVADATPTSQSADTMVTPSPLATSAIPAQPELELPLLYDDFARLTSGWTPLFVDPQGIVDGYSAQSFAFSTASADQLLYNVLPKLDFVPTRYAVDLQPVEGKGVFGLMLEVRGDPANYAGLAYYGVGLTTGGDAVVFAKAAGGELQVLQLAEHATAPLVPGAAVRLAVDRDGERWVVSVDGKAALSVPVGASEHGTVGFFARAVDRLAVRFDNLLLSAAAPGDQPACATIRTLFDSAASGAAMRGADVLIAQRRLARLGYDPGPEGDYSPQTVAAVRAFQARNGLPADGAVGGPTWCRLLSGEAVLAGADQSERAANQALYRPIDIALDAGLPAPLLLSVRGDDGLWQIGLALPGRSSVFYIDTGGDAFDPAWEPQKRLLAFTSMRMRSDQDTIWLLDATSGEVRQVSPPDLQAQFPTWSPDGSKLMFSTVPPEGKDKVARNYIYSPTDGRLSMWSDEQTGWSDWSHFGMVAFTHLTEHSFDIFVANADGSNAVNLTNTDDDHEDIAAWSPNDDMIAFVRNPKSDSNQRQLFVMQPDGSEVRQLTTLPGPNSNPVWLDETTIAFIHQSSISDRQIYLLRLSGELRQLSRNDGRVWFLGRMDGTN